MNKIEIDYSEDLVLTESVCNLKSEQGKLAFSNNYTQYIKLLAYSFGKRYVDSWENDEFICLLNKILSNNWKTLL